MNSQTQAQTFLQDIIKVYKKYALCLGHEDSQGAFKIEPYCEHNVEWLLQAAQYLDESEESADETK